MRYQLLVSGLALLVSAISASATTINVPGDQPAIQAGIEAASAGDTVLVACDTYYEHDIALKDSVVLRSATGEGDCVTIDAQELGRVFYADALSAAGRIEGFTVTGGNAAGGGLGNQGGGLMCVSGASPTLVNVFFSDNHAAGDGGGVHCRDQSSPALTDCVFSGNSAGSNGGGLYCRVESSPTLTGCVITGNTATNGAGIRCYSSCAPSLTACTIAGNSAYRGGGLLCAGTCSATLENVIVWGNCAQELGDEVYLGDAGSSVSFTCCDVDSSGAEGAGTFNWVSGNIFTDPRFSAPEPCESAPTLAGDYRLLHCSPCFNDPGCGDIGALGEGPGSCVWRVPGDVPTIQAGIDSAAAGDTVLVAAGTYHETFIQVNKSGIVLKGETDLATGVTIDAQSGGYIFAVTSVENTTIEGFTLTATGTQPAILCEFSDATFNNCTMVDNGGVGIDGVGSSPTLSNCTFHSNESSGWGGGAKFNQCSPTFNDCLFSDNTSYGGGGGGIALTVSGSLTLNRCTFTGNSAPDGGGLVLLEGCTATLTDCVFSGNSATGPNSYGGVAFLYYTGADVTATGCTFYGNSAAYGSGFSIYSGSTLTLENSIIAFGLGGSAVWCPPGTGSAMAACCDIYGNAGGDWIDCLDGQLDTYGNISEDPLFCHPETGDFLLDRESPCLAPACGQMGPFGQGCGLIIAGVEDVGNDQGLQVRVRWDASPYDRGEREYAVTAYDVWRRIDPLAGGPAPPLRERPSGELDAPRGEWDFVVSLPASGEESYATVSPTLCDSTEEGGSCFSTFFVRARTEDPLTYFESFPDSGYSIDNLEPTLPGDPPPLAPRPPGRTVWGMGLMRELGDGAEITAVADVAGDEGRCVRVTWNRDAEDTAGTEHTVTAYTVWRRIDPLPGETLDRAPGPLPGEREYPAGEWDYLVTVPAAGQPSYDVLCPTLCDSTIALGLYWSVFFVRTHTDTLTVCFESLPDSGYSVDNMEPSAPRGLMTTPGPGTVSLAWDPNEEEDLNYYAVYRDTVEDFDPGVPIGYSVLAEYEDTELPGPGPFWYKVTATDMSGNESEASLPAGAETSVGRDLPLPTVFFLGPAVPNPFNPVTDISYGIPAGAEISRVVLRIFDPTGRRVRVLADAHRGPGEYRETWDGTDRAGHAAASGVYFYRLEWNGESETKRMVLIR